MFLALTLFTACKFKSTEISLPHSDTDNAIVIHTIVYPSSSGKWILDIESNIVIRTAFVSQDIPKKYSTDWVPVTKGVKFQDNGFLEILPKGKKRFRVKIQPSYVKQKPKSYTPFIKFSPNSILVHSDQFRLSKVNGTTDFIQNIEFKHGHFKSVSLNAESRKSVTICSSCDDKYIYFSDNKNVVSNKSIVYSENLPAWLRNKVANYYIYYFDLLSQKFPHETSEAPVLFVGFDASTISGPYVDAGYNAEQIMLTFHGPEWKNEYKPLEFQALWILVHELTHHWNGFLYTPTSFSSKQTYEDSIEDAWMYEGGSEAITFILMMEGEDSFFKQEAINKVRHTISTCNGRRNDIISNVYGCGLAINLYTDFLCERPKSIIDVWGNVFKHAKSKQYNSALFLEATLNCMANNRDIIELKNSINDGVKFNLDNLNYFEQVKNDFH